MVRRMPPGEGDPVVESKFSLADLLTYNNPKKNEYTQLQMFEGKNECASMRATAVDWDEMPKMRKHENGKILPFGEHLSHRVINPLLGNANGCGNGIFAMDQLLPLAHYVEAIKMYYPEEGLDERRASEDIDKSNEDSMRELNALIDSFNLDLDRIKRENDIKAVQEFVKMALIIFRKKDEFTEEFSGQFFDKSLRGQILVDLGYGKDYSAMEDFARKFGVSTFIGVDKFNYPEMSLDPTKPASQIKVGGMTVVDVHADMLDFVSRLKSGSVNFTINHIDDSLIDNLNFHKALATEIARATRVGGTAFGTRSTSINLLQQEKSFKQRICQGYIERYRGVYERMK